MLHWEWVLNFAKFHDPCYEKWPSNYIVTLLFFPPKWDLFVCEFCLSEMVCEKIVSKMLVFDRKWLSTGSLLGHVYTKMCDCQSRTQITSGQKYSRNLVSRTEMSYTDGLCKHERHHAIVDQKILPTHGTHVIIISMVQTYNRIIFIPHFSLCIIYFTSFSYNVIL